MGPASETPAAIEFGQFVVIPHRREVFVEGRPLDLGGRAFDVFVALLEAPGAIVSRQALMERVWPDRIVEENSLQVQISALRKALGADRGLIRTIAGRGYQFTGQIRSGTAGPVAPTTETHPVANSVRADAPTNLPGSITALIGRDAEMEEVGGLAAANRLVTLCGVGGIGKTRLAIEVARRLLPTYQGGVWLAELGPLSDPGLVPATVAAALGVELPEGELSMERMAKALDGKQLMLVLDNCEHVIDVAAQVTEALLRGNPGMRVIATSRDPLRAEGECIYQAPPLALPREGRQDPADTLRYGAVRLFVERARAADPQFSPEARILPAVASICRRLDGIPLSIELAAARADALSVEEIASRLDDRFDLLTGGRRTALPRQRTLRATLDWSYDLLTEVEQSILRQLSIFAAGFTPRAVDAVAVFPGLTSSRVFEVVMNLVMKSIVAADTGGPETRYRLLETTRAYALEKLEESGERNEVARRHAEYFRDFFQKASAESQTRPAGEWMVAYAFDTDNVRAALDWAFSAGGDPMVGAALVVASVPYYFRFSRLEEYRGRVDQALASLHPGSECDPRLEIARAELLSFAKDRVQEAKEAWASAIKLSETRDDTDSRLRALRGLYAHQLTSGTVRDAIASAERVINLAAHSPDPSDRLIGDGLLAGALHFLGDQAGARHHIEHMLADYPHPAPASHTIRFRNEQRALAQAFLARVLWLQGFPDQAMEMAWNVADWTQLLNHLPTICNVLGLGACPVAILAGDLAAAEDFLTRLIDSATRYWPDHLWAVWGRCFEGMVSIQQGDSDSGVARLRTGLDRLSDTGFDWPRTTFLGALAEGLASTGETTEGLATIDEALARCARREELWCMPEMMRLEGVLLLGERAPGAAIVAEDHFLQGLDVARRQGALSWELRCATSLAQLRRDQGRREDALTVVAPVYERFTEGFATADLRSARALIDELS